jgi:hypothetical protein
MQIISDELIGHSQTPVAMQGAVEDPSPDVPPTSGEADSHTWIDFATPVICDVIVEHAYWTAGQSDPLLPMLHCACGYRPHCLMEWREHVAPIIAERLEAACLALDLDLDYTGFYKQPRK